MTAPLVEVVGLKALAKDINRLTSDQSGPLFKAMKAAGAKAAAPIVERARAALPRQSGRLAGTVRASGSRTGATIRMGSAAVPYAGPVDFGGYPGDRAYIPNGRYLFPAASGLASAAADDYTASLTQIFASDIWTNTATTPGSIHD